MLHIISNLTDQLASLTGDRSNTEIKTFDPTGNGTGDAGKQFKNESDRSTGITYQRLCRSEEKTFKRSSDA